MSRSEDADVLRELRRRTRRSFLVGGAAALAGLAGFRWLTTRAEDDGVPWPLRRALEVDEGLSEELFDGSRLARTFPPSAIEPLRQNGAIGLADDFDPASWTLEIEGIHPGAVPGDAEATTASLTIDAIRALPRVEMITEFKCIEGWSNVVQWAGARLSDLMRVYPPSTRAGGAPDLARPADLVRYVAMETPNAGYYVGLDMASALHPQTLLAYEINGEPLPPEHGAPLRLAIPVKYGIKNIKRVGRVRYTDRRPRDFWAEQGYDYYAGH
jgi:DMSO/TMAO reductase YedYZ molybdopterin-dependent catalytic subunit